jgi:hypothetical protein
VAGFFSGVGSSLVPLLLPEPLSSLGLLSRTSTSCLQAAQDADVSSSANGERL